MDRGCTRFLRRWSGASDVRHTIICVRVCHQGVARGPLQHACLMDHTWAPWGPYVTSGYSSGPGRDVRPQDTSASAHRRWVRAFVDMHDCQTLVDLASRRRSDLIAARSARREEPPIRSKPSRQNSSPWRVRTRASPDQRVRLHVRPRDAHRPRASSIHHGATGFGDSKLWSPRRDGRVCARSRSVLRSVTSPGQLGLFIELDAEAPRPTPL